MSDRPRVVIDGIEYVWCDGAWIGFSDPWTPVTMSAAEMARKVKQ